MSETILSIPIADPKVKNKNILINKIYKQEITNDVILCEYNRTSIKRENRSVLNMVEAVEKVDKQIIV